MFLASESHSSKSILWATQECLYCSIEPKREEVKVEKKKYRRRKSFRYLTEGFLFSRHLNVLMRCNRSSFTKSFTTEIESSLGTASK